MTTSSTSSITGKLIPRNDQKKPFCNEGTGFLVLVNVLAIVNRFKSVHAHDNRISKFLVMDQMEPYVWL